MLVNSGAEFVLKTWKFVPSWMSNLFHCIYLIVKKWRIIYCLDDEHICYWRIFYRLFLHVSGDPRTPSSLHHNTQVQPSQYVQALQAIGRVVEDYDTYVKFRECTSFMHAIKYVCWYQANKISRTYKHYASDKICIKSSDTGQQYSVSIEDLQFKSESSMWIM